MLLVLKILLAIASYVFICFTKKHMWARILSVCTGISWILWMIIPSISSEIPKMSALWQSIFLVTIFIFGYMFIIFTLSSFRHDYKRVYKLSIIGLGIAFFVGCVVGIIYYNIYESNIERVSQRETNVISSVTLVATNANSELSGKLEGSAQGSYVLFAGSTQATINGTLTTEHIIEYWYYASDGSINPGSVPKKAIKIFFIEDNETPRMETVVETKQLIETNYNKMIKTTYGKQEINRTYIFYVPKGSILEKYDFNE